MAPATKKAAPKAASKTTPKTPAKTAAKPAASKPAAIDLTAIDDGVSIKVADQHATLKINGTFDQDGLIAVAKRVNQARAEVS